ncbi:HAMP domain-containing protein, partial [Aliiroseovarius sp. CAU 1755]
MHHLARYRIAHLLPVVMILLVGISVCGAVFVSYRESRASLLAGTEQMMQALVESRRVQVERAMERNRADLVVSAKRSATARALKSLTRAWKVLDGNREKALQRLYIDENPHAEGLRHELAWAGDDSTYSTVHAQIHPEFRSMQTAYGYYDVFLLDLDGNLIYSVSKERDFATNLNTGPYKDSGLGRAYRAAMTLEDGEIAFADYEAYAPSNAAPAAFIAMPVFNRRNEREGVLAYQLASQPINAITNQAAELGESGEVILVGPDGLARSTSRFAEENWVGRHEITSEASRLALGGSSGVMKEVSAKGVPIVTAYAPLTAYGTGWAIVAQKHQAEVFQSANRVLSLLIMKALPVLLAVSVVAVMIARGVARPLVQVGADMSAVAGGAFSTQIAGTDRQDEIGAIARTLANFRTSLAEAKHTHEESSFRGAAFSNSSSSMLMLDPAGVVTHANAAALQMFAQNEAAYQSVSPEFSAGNVVGTSFDNLLADGLKPRLRDALAGADQFPIQMEDAVGEVRNTIDINRVWDADENLIGYVVEIKDITNDFLNRALQDTIEAHQIRLDIDLSGTVIGANGLLREALDCDARALEAVALSDLSSDERVKEAVAAAGQGIATVGVFTLSLGSKKEIDVEGSFAPVLDSKGVLLRIVFLGKDVTSAQRALAEAEARRAA